MADDGNPLTRAQRLDRLPFTPRHTRLLVGSGIGWALDAMDVGLIAFVMAALRVEWQLDPGTLSWIASIGFVGMALGATLGGLLADRVGRRQVFAITLLVYGIATGASALATGVAMLICLRFVVGLGLGAELPVASTLVSEFAPRRIRGRVVVALEGFWAIGWLVAALIGYQVIPHVPQGWRWALAIGVVPTAYAAVVRWGCRSPSASWNGRDASPRPSGSSPISSGPPASNRCRVPTKCPPPPRPRPRSGRGSTAGAPPPCGRSGSGSTSPTTARSPGCPPCCSARASTWSSPSSTR